MWGNEKHIQSTMGTSGRINLLGGRSQVATNFEA